MNQKYIVVISCIISIIMLFACDKNENGESGPLAIEKITLVTSRDSTVHSVELASFILVHGSGFNKVTRILINDIQVDLDETYITPTLISLNIPRVLPGTVDNKITVTTSAGTVQGDLELNIPELKINGMTNEFTLPGSELEITGDYFDLYKVDKDNGKVLFGTQEVSITEATATSVKVTVPADVTIPAEVKLVTAKGAVKVPGKFRDPGLMLYDAQTNLGWGGGGGKGTIIKNNNPYEPISGDYIRIIVTAAQTGWIGEAIAIGGINYTQDILDNPQNYMLKFEMNTVLPVSLRPLLMSFGGVEWRDWSSFKVGGTVDTHGKWKTFSINLRKVFNDKATGNIKLPPLTGGMIQIFPLTWIAEDVDLCFDNLRIVPVD